MKNTEINLENGEKLYLDLEQAEYWLKSDFTEKSNFIKRILFSVYRPEDEEETKSLLRKVEETFDVLLISNNVLKNNEKS